MVTQGTNTAAYAAGALAFEGDRLALICDDDKEHQGRLSSVLKDMGYDVAVAANAEDAYEKIKFNSFGVVVLNEKFSGGTPENNEMLELFQSMNINDRRNILVALVGNGLKTMDNWTAYAGSVNLIISEGDLPNSTAILKKALAENNLFYRVYKGVLKEMGKL
jgi:DNA-binding NtrC family response regulator